MAADEGGTINMHYFKYVDYICIWGSMLENIRKYAWILRKHARDMMMRYILCIYTLCMCVCVYVYI